MKYTFILCLLIAGTLLINEPTQYAAMGRGTGRIYSRGGGTVTPPIVVPPVETDTYFWLREDSGVRLREDGTKSLRETAP